MMDWNRFQLQSEFHVRETTRDIAILHNYTLYATAQKKYVYIYDKDGVELHILRNHIQPNVLDFLPYHFLLVSVGQAGYLKYQDTSTGQLVAEHRTKLGDCRVMRQNPFNACMCLGHGNGTVQLVPPPSRCCLSVLNAQRHGMCVIARRHGDHVDAQHEPTRCEDAGTPGSRYVSVLVLRW